MALNLEVPNTAPILPVELTDQLTNALGIVSDTCGGSSLGQQSMKILQSFPIAWACLAVKEAPKKSKDVRDREASRCQQEVALPGFMKLLLKAIEESGGKLRFPAGWETKLYYTTLGAKSKKRSLPASRKTFMQSPSTAWSRFNFIKKEFTKGPAIWFPNNEVPDTQLPSGETRQQLMAQFHLAMYKASVEDAVPALLEYFGERGVGGSGSGA